MNEVGSLKRVRFLWYSPPRKDRKMNSSKVKSLIIVSALFLFTGLVTVGCKGKTEDAWVNTGSLPGQTFKKHHPVTSKSERHRNPKIVYLGAERSSQRSDFGPRDVSFDFKDLK